MVSLALRRRISAFNMADERKAVTSKMHKVKGCWEVFTNSTRLAHHEEEFELDEGNKNECASDEDVEKSAIIDVEDLEENATDEETQDLEEDNEELLQVSDEEDDAFGSRGSSKVPFKVRYESDLTEEIVDKIDMAKMKRTGIEEITTGHVEHFHFPDVVSSIEPYCCNLEGSGDALLSKAQIKDKLVDLWKSLNKSKSNSDGSVTQVQSDLAVPMLSYNDVFYYGRTFSNAEGIRRLYCLHIVNHVLKSRLRILKNNAKIVHLQKNDLPVEDEFRDQGLTRPKVLILVPFRDACFRVVNLLTKLALASVTKGQVMNATRFKAEYGPSKNDDQSDAVFLPDDHKMMFSGNIDDCFRIGLTITRRTVKLFAPFYSSDIIVASPLGLRTLIGVEGEEDRDYDYLSSIEILLMDQADVYLMQNWEHVWHILDHMNLTPKESHDADFSRLRMWTASGWSKYYRQTLLFAGMQTPELNGVFNKHCHNYAGKVKVYPSSIKGSIQQVVSRIPQVFARINCSSHTDVADARFNHFINRVLPDFKSTLTTSTAIFIPSYFDFIRLRNHFKKEEISFCQISEYTSRSNISRYRYFFRNKRRHFILFTERFYFFYRYRIKGIKHIVFYELPMYAHFYSEIVNFMRASEEAGTAGASCTVLFSKFDAYRLENILGSDRCKQMLKSDKDVHMIITGS